MANEQLSIRLLIVHRYFYPDTPTYAHLLRKLAAFHATYLKKVDVLSTMPSYYGSSAIGVKDREKYEGYQISRYRLLPEPGRNLLLRLINSLLFASRVFFRIAIYGRKRYDLVQVATTPPILVAGAVSLATRIAGIRYIYHCQDIYPDIVMLGKDNPSFLHRITHRFDSSIMRRAARIVVLSNDMKQNIVESRKLDPGKIEVINNFSFSITPKNKVPENIPNEIEEFRARHNKLLVFAGNIGVFQNLDSICRVVKELQKEIDFGLLIIGEGVERERLTEEFDGPGFLFTGYIDQRKLSQIYNLCHAGIAPVVKGIEQVAFPSKIISYLLYGLPVLSFSSKKSDINKMVGGNQWGVNYSFEGEEELQKCIKRTMQSEFNRDKIQSESRHIFSEDYAFGKWQQLMVNI